MTASVLHNLSARTTDPMGRPMYRDGVEPYAVFGGFKMATCDWVRTEDGWDCDYEIVSPTVYATADACRAAIAALQTRALGRAA